MRVLEPTAARSAQPDRTVVCAASGLSQRQLEDIFAAANSEAAFIAVVNAEIAANAEINDVQPTQCSGACWQVLRQQAQAA